MNSTQTKTHTRRKAQKQRNGTTTVEFAFVFPIIFLIIFGMLEINRAMSIIDSARTAVIAGAREGSVAVTSADNVEQEMNDILDLFGVRTRTVTVSPEVIDASVNEVTITVEVPLDSDNGLFMGHFIKHRLDSPT